MKLRLDEIHERAYQLFMKRDDSAQERSTQPPMAILREIGMNAELPHQMRTVLAGMIPESKCYVIIQASKLKVCIIKVTSILMVKYMSRYTEGDDTCIRKYRYQTNSIFLSVEHCRSDTKILDDTRM